MGYRRFFKTLFRISIILGFIWFFIFISPDNCNCSSKLLHNTIWGILGFMIYGLFAMILNVNANKSFPDKLFFKLCKIPKSKYKYEVKHFTAKDGQTFYIPTVKTVHFYPPFYICVDEDKNPKYSLVDPINNKQYFCKSKEDALYAISLVKNDINDKSVKYEYDMWICHICPARKDCCFIKKNPTDLTVKVNKTFNK